MLIVPLFDVIVLWSTWGMVFVFFGTWPIWKTAVKMLLKPVKPKSPETEATNSTNDIKQEKPVKETKED